MTSTLATTIGERLRAEIVTGRKGPGVKLLLHEIRAEFNASLSPIREALSRLASEGLVTAEDQRGYRVAPVSRANLGEILELRVLLECRALRASIERGDDAWEAELLAAHHRLSKYESGERRMSELEEWEGRHRFFHHRLIAACGSPVQLHFCKTLHDMNDRYRRLFLATHEPDRDVPGEHRAIAQAAIARDAEGACRLLQAHIERTVQNILRSTAW